MSNTVFSLIFFLVLVILGFIVFRIVRIIENALFGRKNEKQMPHNERMPSARNAGPSVAPPMNFIPRQFCVVDLETTGVDKQKSEIIQIGAIRVQDGNVVGDFLTYVKPAGYIPKEASVVNHITDDMVEGAPPLEDVLSHLFDFVRDSIVVGYNNSRFDIPLLKRDFLVELNRPFENDYIDVMSMAYKSPIQFANMKLSTVAGFFGIPNDGAHDALFDCIMTFRCLIALSQTTSPVILSSRDISTPVCRRPIQEPLDIQQKVLSIISDICPDFSIKERGICLSGSFDLGDPGEMEHIISVRGGILKNAVSQKVDYLIMGNNPSEKWKYGKYGDKLKKAYELIERGDDIKVVSESVLANYLR